MLSMTLTCNLLNGKNNLTFCTHSARSECTYRYSGEEDVLKVYFTKATPCLIVEPEDEDGIILDWDKEHRIVAIEFLDASSLFDCHFFDTANDCSGKRSFKYLYIKIFCDPI
jgi:uncharacterized protein YuzE